MVKFGDKLVCITGNDLYLEGKSYIVGEFVNDKYFQLLTGHNDELWYAAISDEGISVPFHSSESGYTDAWFTEITINNSTLNILNSDILQHNETDINSTDSNADALTKLIV